MTKPKILLAAASLLLVACTKENASPPAAQAVAKAESAPLPGKPGEDAATAFAKSLDEAKVKQLLTYEQEMLPHTALLLDIGVKGALKANGDGEKMAAELSKDERVKKLTEITNATLAKAGLTQAEVTAFASLTGNLFGLELANAGNRKALAENGAKIEKWKALEVEKAKLPMGQQFEFLTKHRDDRPLEDYMIKIYEEQLAAVEAERKAFAAKYGDQALAAIDKHQAEFLAVRQQQMDAFMGGK